VAPFGMEEGSEADVTSEELGLVVGEPAEFHFLSSSTRREDQVGTRIEDARRAELTELAPVSTELPATAGAGGAGREAGQLIPVTLRSKVTEIGTLELYCVERAGDRRWKLEYNVRDTHE
jgi:hypothetical protein